MGRATKRQQIREAEMSRRDLLKKLGLGAGALGLTPGLIEMLMSSAKATTTTRKFVHFFLLGGWDAAFSTDPLINRVTMTNIDTSLMGANTAQLNKKTISNGGSYDNDHAGRSTAVLAGKSNLVVGQGFAAAVASGTSAFGRMNTAFVNGLYVPVTAHELATNYLFSGRLSLSRSREYPAITALVGAKRGGFPAHLVLGGNIPLSDTVLTAPPLSGSDMSVVKDLVSGPEASSTLGTQSKAAYFDLTKKLNGEFLQSQGGDPEATAKLWKELGLSMPDFYAKDFKTKLAINAGITSDFNIQTDGNGDPYLYTQEAHTATAFLALKNAVSSVITVVVPGYDTHTTNSSAQVPAQQRFTAMLNAFVSKLANTADPDSPSQSLMDTTTILISSEFVRSPTYTDANGSMHWQSASAILMGSNVQDNKVIGTTNHEGHPMGWTNGKPVPYDSNLTVQTNALLPEHLMASILSALGFQTEANSISEVQISGLFT